ncbi:MAG TPA: hypothetical protein VKT49_21995 [Bryobacteraceae bacterium]|nr:hypothetical protein [Bryobacteraceae bacterium]
MLNRGVLIGILFAGAALHAQWLNHADPRTPRTKDGKPNLSAPAPRLNGKPDFTGVWQGEKPSGKELAAAIPPQILNVQVDLTDLTRNSLNVFWGTKPEDEPLRPAAAEILKQRMTEQPLTSRCLPAGVPFGAGIYSIKMIQAPQEIVMLNETGDPPRQIYIDGRKLPKDPDPIWMGYSTGQWQGDTLVVDTIGFNDRSWLDTVGHPHSESLHLTERYRRPDFGHMEVEVVIDDAKYYTHPFSFKTIFQLIPDSDVIEFVCGENEKDRAHITN